MKFKLDENLGSRTASLIAALGHDVQTVSQEKLNGVDDVHLLSACGSEGRCLITLDLDFADVLRFPPANERGHRCSASAAHGNPEPSERTGARLVAATEREPITGRLWVVEPGRIRVHDDSGA